MRVADVNLLQCNQAVVFDKTTGRVTAAEIYCKRLHSASLDFSRSSSACLMALCTNNSKTLINMVVLT